MKDPVLAFDARFMLHGRVHPHSQFVHIFLRQNFLTPYATRIILYTDREPDRALVRERYDASNLTIKVLGPAGGRWHRLYWLWVSLPRALQRDGAEIFYSSFYFLPGRCRGIRLINSIHDCCVFYIDPKLNRGLLSSPFYLWILKHTMRWTNRRANATMTGSHFSRLMLNRYLGRPLESVRVCYHGLEPVAFVDVQQTPPKDSGYFLFVGSNLPKKNIRQCLAGFARLPQEIRQRYKLRLKSDCYPEDRALIEQLGIGERVEFVRGYLDDKAMADLFAGATLLLLLSYDEGFGLPIIEAFAAGVPVLVSNRAACDELVSLPECKADPRDTGEIADKWLALVVDSELRERCLAEQKRLLAQFTQDAAANAFFEAIVA